MPIYEYQCESCGHHLEKLQKMNDARLTDCPACDKPDLRKLVSAVAFRLKGAGWYETDFKTDKKKNLVGDSDSKKESSSEKSKESANDGKKSETTSAKKESGSSGAKQDSSASKPASTGKTSAS